MSTGIEIVKDRYPKKLRKCNKVFLLHYHTTMNILKATLFNFDHEPLQKRNLTMRINTSHKEQIQ